MTSDSKAELKGCTISEVAVDDDDD